MTWQFTLTGLLIGALVGLTGMGGGSLMMPILVIVFGLEPTYAVGRHPARRDLQVVRRRPRSAPR